MGIRRASRCEAYASEHSEDSSTKATVIAKISRVRTTGIQVRIKEGDGRLNFRSVCKKTFEGLKWAISLVAATICFALAICLTLLDRIPAATLMAALFVVLVLFHYLPQMESFKAFSVEAKMRARLSEAEDILAKIKEAAKVSAILAYHTIGWGSRMGPPIREKQAVADNVDKLARTVGIDQAELDALKREYISFIIWDLYGVFRKSIYDLKTLLDTELVSKLNAAGGSNDANPEAGTLSKRIQNLRDFGPEERSYPIADLRESCTALLPMSGLLDDADDKAIRSFLEEIVLAGTACKREGRMTDAAADLIEGKKSKGI